MKIALIGATGFVGTAVLKELSGRGHEMIAIARDTSKVSSGEKVTTKNTDIFNEAEVTAAIKGADAVVSAYNPGWTNPEIYTDSIKGSKLIQEAVKKAGIRRFIVVGGAGSLFVAPGVQLIDTPGFPEAYKAGASAARDYLNIIKEEKELDWTFVSPAIELVPGERTGKYRTALDSPVFNNENRSTISVNDLAVAIADELEKPQHIKQRFTAAY